MHLSFILTTKDGDGFYNIPSGIHMLTPVHAHTCNLRQDAAALEERMAEVKRALVEAGLPFGAKASCPQNIDYYPFHHDQKNWKVFWDVRKVWKKWRRSPHTMRPHEFSHFCAWPTATAYKPFVLLKHPGPTPRLHIVPLAVFSPDNVNVHTSSSCPRASSPSSAPPASRAPAC